MDSPQPERFEPHRPAPLTAAVATAASQHQPQQHQQPDPSPSDIFRGSLRAQSDDDDPLDALRRVNTASARDVSGSRDGTSDDNEPAPEQPQYRHPAVRGGGSTPRQASVSSASNVGAGGLVSGVHAPPALQFSRNGSLAHADDSMSTMTPPAVSPRASTPRVQDHALHAGNIRELLDQHISRAADLQARARAARTSPRHVSPSIHRGAPHGHHAHNVGEMVALRFVQSTVGQRRARLSGSTSPVALAVFPPPPMDAAANDAPKTSGAYPAAFLEAIQTQTDETNKRPSNAEEAPLSAAVSPIEGSCEGLPACVMRHTFTGQADAVATSVAEDPPDAALMLDSTDSAAVAHAAASVRSRRNDETSLQRLPGGMTVAITPIPRAAADDADMDARSPREGLHVHTAADMAAMFAIGPSDRTAAEAAQARDEAMAEEMAMLDGDGRAMVHGVPIAHNTARFLHHAIATGVPVGQLPGQAQAPMPPPQFPQSLHPTPAGNSAELFVSIDRRHATLVGILALLTCANVVLPFFFLRIHVAFAAIAGTVSLLLTVASAWRLTSHRALFDDATKTVSVEWRRLLLYCRPTRFTVQYRDLLEPEISEGGRWSLIFGFPSMYIPSAGPAPSFIVSRPPEELIVWGRFIQYLRQL